MKVLFIRSNPVDPDSRVEKEVNSLIKAGHEVEIFAWDRNNTYLMNESNLSLKNGISKIYRTGIVAAYGGGFKKNLIPLLKFQYRLYKWLSSNYFKYDAIHACDFDTAYVSQKVAKKKDIKFVYDIFDFYVDSFNVPTNLKNIIKKIDLNIIDTADATIICTEKRREQIKGSSPKKLVVIQNSPPQSNFKTNNFNLNKDKIKIVYVGILAEGRFIKEIAEIVKDDSRFEFHVAGFGKLEQYFLDLSKENDNIFYYGKISYSETLELENSCDIMTAIYNPEVPNHYYAAPNKFYEALMLGKPLLMARNTGMDEVLETEKIGKVINYDKRSLEEGLFDIINMSDDWENMGNKMKAIYKKRYSWRKMERKLIELYNEIEGV